MLRHAGLAFATLLALPVTGCSHGGADDFTAASGGCSSIGSIKVDGQNICGILDTLGTPNDDYSYRLLGEMQRSFWNLERNVKFNVIDDCGSGNAFATPNPPEISLGLKLYRDLKARPSGILALKVILAHEWAHQVQFENNLIDRNEPARRMELEADAFAGYYMYVGAMSGSAALMQTLSELHKLGDEEFNSATHHGTSIEREHMGLVGMQLGEESVKNGVQPDYAEMHEYFRRKILKSQSLPGVTQAEIDHMPEVRPPTENTEYRRP